MLILISGGSRSGKSLYAEIRLLELSEAPLCARIYLAASGVYDEEMRARVRRHRAMRRGKGFVTIERERDMTGILADIPEGSCVLIETLTAWAANEMFRGNSVIDGAYVAEKVYLELEGIIARSEHVVIVSDDIFADSMAYDDTTEAYLRMLASLQIRIASEADEVTECFAGLPLHYKLP